MVTRAWVISFGVSLTLGKLLFDQFSALVLLYVSVPSLNVNLHTASLLQKSFRAIETSKLGSLSFMMTEFFCPTNPYYENESGLYNGKFWIRKSILTTRGGKLQRDGSEEKRPETRRKGNKIGRS